MKSKLYGSLSFISFLILSGTPSASISLTQMIIQSILLLVAFVVFAKLAGAFDYSNNKY